MSFSYLQSQQGGYNEWGYDDSNLHHKNQRRGRNHCSKLNPFLICAYKSVESKHEENITCSCMAHTN